MINHKVDIEKLQEISHDMLNWRLPSRTETCDDDYRKLVVIMDGFTERLTEIITPPLPTLAELIEAGNKPEEYQWAWADTEDGLWIITTAGDFNDEHAYVMDKDGRRFAKGWSQLRPRTDLHRLEWPAQVSRNPETPPAETLNNPSSDTPRNPCPEDVPPGEPWLVLSEGRRAIGYRNDPGARLPWVITYQACMEFDYCYDSDITLVSRLVPEPEA